VTAASAAVKLRARPGITYQSGLGGRGDTTDLARRTITDQAGIMLAVSQTVDPAATRTCRASSPRRCGQGDCYWAGRRYAPRACALQDSDDPST
jgi:hypothetical protein